MEDTFAAGTVSISGSGLSIESTHFVVGTGPLFDFGHFAGDSVDFAVECVVSLSASHLVNATSTRDSSFSVARRMWLTQRLVGSSVTRSTNHFSGTSGIDLNWGADTLVSNCSFSHIVTNAAPAPVTEPPTPSDTSGIHYYVSHTKLIDSYSQKLATKPMWIISCLFNSLSSSDGSGGALSTGLDAHLVIKHSTFTKCTAPNGTGGAVCTSYTLVVGEVPDFDLTIFACQFSRNSAARNGGQCHIQFYNTITIAQCTFSDSRSTTSTPLTQISILNFAVVGPSRIDNCTISNNEGTQSGGMTYWAHSPEAAIDLTDVLFLNNICTYEKDVLARLTDFTISKFDGTFTAFDCFSTSALPRSGVLNTKVKPYTVTSVLPDLVGPTINKVDVKKQVSSEDTGFEVIVKMEGMFIGTTRKYDVSMKSSTGTTIVTKGVSFDRTSGTMTIPMSTTSLTSLIPSTAYTITEVKKSTTQSASNEFSVGSIPEPDWTWWHHTPESRAGILVELSFTTPVGPTLTDISADLDPSNLNEVIVVG
ncbi:hypothetical protein BLNAU_4791 [Blattamonas nauphoetae]|uniref:Uncharacterized protein n=1 Tax=Blattamonas nauphoetae TaxID=2049346 RepID=A0ABQ9Y8Z8_9EUKA|nr:hypothetical protein BLNAU_4791 [Blattamonas nauphoetae]